MSAMASPVVGVTPIQQVINMLTEMKKKGEVADATEKKMFAEYTEWTSDQSTNLEQEITWSKAQIDKLTGFIEKADNDVFTLGEEIKALDDEVATMENDRKAAAALRESENGAFLLEEQDYAESVDAIDRAITKLSAQNYDRPQQLLQIQKMAGKSHGMRRVLAALLEIQSHDDGAPEVAAYESQSGGLIEMLKGLSKKFREELADLQREEANRAHAFEMQNMHLTDLITVSTQDREEKAALKAKQTAASAEAKGNVVSTKSDLAADQKLLSDTKVTFEEKKATFDGNQKVRAGELEAIVKAIEIMSSPDVSGLVQVAPVVSKAPSFLQKKSQSMKVVVQSRASDMLKMRAEKLSSKLLASVAADVAANPFAKVIDMIESLIAKLKEEAAAEGAHKAWCDEELKKNKLKRNRKGAAVDRLSAEINEMQTSIQDMATAIKTLSAEQAELTTAMAESTEIRNKEKSENAATISDSQAGADAVKRAIVVLREFYSSQSFLQTHKQAPEMAAYKGMGSASGGVVGMMEVIQSDFTRIAAETKAEEGQNQREYDAFMKDGEFTKKHKHDLEFKTNLEKDQAEFKLEGMKKDLVGNSVELDKANDYYENLKPNCLEVHVSFEERAAQREAEIAALKDAYKMLDEM